MDKVLRIIDANFNRAREGLRVIEDGIRFYYNADRTHIKQIKDIRHSLASIIEKNFGLLKVKAARDTVHDTGKVIDTRKREDIREVIERNFLRVSEALRVMEEYSKATKPAVSSLFHNLRFKLYKAEKDVSLYIQRKEIPSPYLSVLLNIGKDISLKSVKMTVDCAPDIIILRSTGTDDGYFLKVARKIRKIVPPAVKYLISGRPDICLLCDADGVFLDKKDIPYEEVRKILQDRTILTDNVKTVNIPIKEIDITRPRLKELFTDDMAGIILMAGVDIPKDIETIIKIIKKEVEGYGRRRKETAGKK